VVARVAEVGEYPQATLAGREAELHRLAGIVGQVIASNEKAVADYRAGKDTAIKFLMGQVMRETRGRANPQVVQDVIKKQLEAK